MVILVQVSGSLVDLVTKNEKSNQQSAKSEYVPPRISQQHGNFATQTGFHSSK